MKTTRLFCDSSGGGGRGGAEVKFITRIDMKNKWKGQVPSPRETSHPQFSRDAPSLLWPPLALQVWIQAPAALGSGDWLAPFQVGFPRQSLRWAPLRDCPGAGGGE